MRATKEEDSQLVLLWILTQWLWKELCFAPKEQREFILEGGKIICSYPLPDKSAIFDGLIGQCFALSQ